MNRSKTVAAKCFVPFCKNTTTNSPEKLFVNVSDNGLRARWCHELNIAYSRTKRMFCCSNHFDEEFYGRPLILADRELCESGIDDILKEAKDHEVALLVVGDPLGATTHTDMLLRAKDLGVKTQIVHNASIMNAISCCGLQLYNFGETVSIPYWTENWHPDSFFEKIVSNFNRNLHTLCLLDIKVKEPTEESLTKKVRQYMDPKFMTVAEAASQIVQIILKKPDSEITLECVAIGVSRVGASDQNIIVKTLQEMQNVNLGPPLHSLVIPGPNLHPLEIDYIAQFR